MRQKKCYIYTRVSTTAQTEGYSLEAQHDKLEKYAEYKGLKIVGDYCDAGKSGKSIKGRPAFMEMLDDITSEKDGISYVLVFKLSRFGRNAADVLKSIQLLADYDVDLICVEDGIDSSTQGGRLTLSILSAVAEIERENINVQFMAGRMQKLMEGGWVGGPAPYGYKNVDKKLVPDEPEADIVKLIYQMYLQEDMQANTVVTWLNDNGYRRIVKGTERKFTSDFIKTVLANPIYCGRLMYNRRTNLKGEQYKPKKPVCVEGNHEPLVTIEQWEAVQSKREKLSSWGKKTDDLDRISMLSGIIKCPICGGGLVHTKNKKINKNRGGYYKTLHFYSCRNYRKAAGRTCDFKHTYNQEKVDKAVIEVIGRVCVTEEFEEAVAASMGSASAVEQYEAEIKKLRKQLHSAEHLKYKLGERLDSLDILSEDYDSEYESIQSRIDDVYEEIEELESKITRYKNKLSNANKGVQSTDNLKKIMQNFESLYEEMDCSERRELCRSFIERIDVYPEDQQDGRFLKSITFKFPVHEETGSENENITFTVSCEDTELTVAEAKATYAEIKAWVLENHNLKVSTLYIAQIKRKYGIDVGTAFNKHGETKNRVPTCPENKEIAIIDALKYFRMLDSSVEYKETVA
ncbi:MAG: recombinase family protein [Blautia sp.]|nr:recombinase family protein [Blautia sp.]